MFIIVLTYKKPLADIEKHLEAHRSFLDKGYSDHSFALSGPKNPRSGGVIISPLKNREQLEKLLEHDPFKIHDLADYEIIEFSPTKSHPSFASLIDAS